MCGRELLSQFKPTETLVKPVQALQCAGCWKSHHLLVYDHGECNVLLCKDMIRVFQISKREEEWYICVDSQTNGL